RSQIRVGVLAGARPLLRRAVLRGLGAFAPLGKRPRRYYAILLRPAPHARGARVPRARATARAAAIEGRTRSAFGWTPPTRQGDPDLRSIVPTRRVSSGHQRVARRATRPAGDSDAGTRGADSHIERRRA